MPKELLSLNPKDGGLGIENPKSIAASQYKASIQKTKIHTEAIKKQEMSMRQESSEGKTEKEIEQQYRREQNNKRKERIECLQIPEHLVRCVAQARDTKASNWLNALPLKEPNLDMNKNQFSDALCLGYNQQIRTYPLKVHAAVSSM